MRNAGTIPEVVLSARPVQARAFASAARAEGDDAFPHPYDLPAHCA
jgi:hypothetical protein